VKLRKKRLMTLLQLFLIHRYKIYSVHYVSPTEDNQRQAEGMKKQGLFRLVNVEVGEIIVADVDLDRVKELLAPDRAALLKLVAGN
jgi:isocitrate lyase